MGALRVSLAALALALSAPAAAEPLHRFEAHIAEASLRFGIPAAWIERVIRAESGGRTVLAGRPITSHAGAMGLMQLMPGTWRDLRAELALGTDPHQPRDNILAGTAYLRKMYDRFGYPGLFAAYNAGPSRYAEALKGRRSLPAETRAYLVAVGGVRADAPAAIIPMPEQSIFFALRTSQAIEKAVPVTASSGIFVSLSGSSARD